MLFSIWSVFLDSLSNQSSTAQSHLVPARGSKQLLVKRTKAALLVLNHNLSDEAKLDEILPLGPSKESEVKE
jgi:hypothetical protein